MEQNSKKNFINVYTASQTGGLKVSACDSRQVISATNNRAQYFAEQAQKYRDEAKQHRDNAKYYAEQNSDVTFEYIDSVKNSLLGEISSKQPAGDYALNSEVNELINDLEQSTREELLNSVPSQENCDGMFLYTNGEETSWKGINSFNLFDTKLSDHILTYEESKGWALQGTYVYKIALAGTRYGYPDFYNKVIEESEQSTSIETVNGVEVRVHSNGHKFYDIANKTAIDEFFDSMGSAWFYGVDTENERVFLPRNSYFEQASTIDVGQTAEAGLPNITGFTDWWSFGNGTNKPTGAFFVTSYANGTGGAGNNPAQLLSFDASRSNAIYGKSDTVQPASVKKLLYICVGNTISYDGVTEVVNQGLEILDQVNQGINVKFTELSDIKLSVDMFNATRETADKIVSYGFPDWWNSVQKTVNTTYTAEEDGWILAEGATAQNEIGVKIDGWWVAYTQAAGSQDSSGYGCLVPINAGQQYIATGTHIYFLPCRKGGL